ncbi:hypothetical protein ACFUJR_38475 [Streptomyces sp. NPDC057271]|uniref:hypothetical protein n=1 Tax=unclassified Streptomyces TaxID=2593676 RepID=UPI00362BA461
MDDWLSRIPSSLRWIAAWFFATSVWWIGGQFLDEPWSLPRCVFYGGVPVAAMKLGQYLRS